MAVSRTTTTETTARLQGQREQLALARQKAAEVRRVKSEESPPTTEQENKFALYFLMTLNATQAAISAGYSPENAQQQGWKLKKRPRVKEIIERMQGTIADDLRVSATSVIRRYADIGFASVSHIPRAVDGSFDVDSATEETKTAISELYVKDGKVIRVRMHSSLQALEALGKHLGLFERDNAQKTPVIQIVSYAHAESVGFNPDGSRKS